MNWAAVAPAHCRAHAHWAHNLLKSALSLFQRDSHQALLPLARGGPLDLATKKVDTNTLISKYGDSHQNQYLNMPPSSITLDERPQTHTEPASFGEMAFPLVCLSLLPGAFVPNGE